MIKTNEDVILQILKKIDPISRHISKIEGGLFCSRRYILRRFYQGTKKNLKEKKLIEILDQLEIQGKIEVKEEKLSKKNWIRLKK